MSSGVLQAALAYAIWGLFPLYFQLVSAVSPVEIVLHRSLWSLAFMLVLLTVLRRWAWLHDAVRLPRTLATFALSALLLSANWLVYVWAVNNGRVVDSSLGYFITPLVNVLLGYFVLRERPRRAQWCALAIAGAGVLWLTFFAGSLPWVGLVLAATFGIYGLMRKTAPLGALGPPSKQAGGQRCEQQRLERQAFVAEGWLSMRRQASTEVVAPRPVPGSRR